MSENGSGEIYRYLGLACRGNNLAMGREAVRDAIRKNRAALIVLSADAGDSLVRSIRRSGEKAEVPLLVFGTKADLGEALGRGATAVVAVTDQGLAEAVQKTQRTAPRTRRNA